MNLPDKFIFTRIDRLGLKAIEELTKLHGPTISAQEILLVNYNHCGTIWLKFSGNLPCCPWCWSHIDGRSTPRTSPIHYRDYCYFQQSDHTNLGCCSKNHQNTIVYLYSSDLLHHRYFVPVRRQGRCKKGITGSLRAHARVMGFGR